MLSVMGGRSARALAVAAWLLVASQVEAQAWTIGPEIDPFPPTGAARDDNPIFFRVGGPAGDGVVVTGWAHPTLLRLDAEGQPVAEEIVRPPGELLAVGANVFFQRDNAPPGNVVQRSLVDASLLETYAGTASAAIVTSLGDVLVTASATTIDRWTLGHVVTTRVPADCTGACAIRDLDCGALTCVVSIGRDAHALAVEVYELDPSAGGVLSGPPVLTLPRGGDVRALAHGWAVSATDGSGQPALTLYDTSWGTVRAFVGASVVDCAADACFGTQDAIRPPTSVRFDASGTTPMPASPYVCTRAVCLRTSGSPLELVAWSVVTGEPAPIPTGLWRGALDTHAFSLFVMGGRARATFQGRAISTTAVATLGDPPSDPVAAPDAIAQEAVGCGDDVVGWSDFGEPLLLDASWSPVPGWVLSCSGARAASVDHGCEIACSDGTSTTVWSLDAVGAMRARGTWGPNLASYGYLAGGVASSYTGGTFTSSWLDLDDPSASPVPLGGDIPLASGHERALMLSYTLPATVYVRAHRGTSSSVPVSVASPTTYPISFVAVFDGTYFLSAWVESPPSTSSASLQIWLARLDVDGHLVEAPTPVTAPFGTASGARVPGPRLATDGAGQSWLVYERSVDDEIPYLVRRARYRTITTGTALGGACATDDACGSGHCVEGLCCTSACDGACDTCAAIPGECTTREPCVLDAGVDGGTDADMTLDASVAADAGTDAASHDAGRDALVADAPSFADAATPPPSTSGCGCRVGAREPTGSALYALAILAMLARRARRH